MKFLPRLATLLLIGVVALLFARGAVGARTLGLARSEAPAPAGAGRPETTAASVSEVVAIPTVPAEPTVGAPGGVAGVVDPAVDTAQNQPGAASAGPAGGSSAVQPAMDAPPAPGRVALTTDRRVIGRPTDTATVAATVTDATGGPLAGVLVTFSLDDGEAGQLSVVQARTDADGVTTTTFAPEIFRGAATVSAATEGGASAQVTIRINCGC